MKRRTELKVKRVGLGLTQRQVAEQLGITAAYYGMIEQGNRTPRLGMAFRIATVLNTQVEAVFPEAMPTPAAEASRG